MSKSFTVGEVKEHGDVDKGLYIIIDNGVYEMVRFLSFYCVTSSFSFFPVVLRNVVGLFYIPLSLSFSLGFVCMSLGLHSILRRARFLLPLGSSLPLLPRLLQEGIGRLVGTGDVQVLVISAVDFPPSETKVLTDSIGFCQNRPAS